MAGLFERDDWQAALRRWREAGLVDAETYAAVQVWESSRAGGRPGRSGRVADVAAYLGVSIAAIAALFLAGALFDDGWGRFGLTLVAGVAAAFAAWWTGRASPTALSDAWAGSAVALVALGVVVLLEDIGDDDQLWAGWLLISVIVIVSGAGMFALVRSRLALVAAAGGLAQLPIALAVEAGAFDGGIFDSYQQGSLDSWELWTTYVLVGLVSAALLFVIGRPNRWVDPSLTVWGRLGASIGAGLAILTLAGASTSPIIDWLVLLAGWVVTAWALRDGRAELLPASALLLIGALVGGLSDLGDGARLSLTILVLLTGVELTALGMVGPRLLGRLADHWLTPFWESALLIGGVTAAAVLAATSPELATVGIVWALIVLAAGLIYERRLAFAFGAIGVYAALLALVIDQFESSVAAAVGTLVFGLLVVLAGIVWRRRFGRLTVTAGRS